MCFTAGLCFAQDIDDQIREIKLSGQYYIGESSGKWTSATRDSVETRLKLQAQQDLALNIQSFICASIEQQETTAGSSTSENLNKQMLISGSMIAGNVQYLVQTDKKKMTVVAYLTKTDMTNSEQDYIKRIQETVKLAETKERESGSSAALPLYYTAWLQSSFVSSSIPYTTIDKDKKQDIRAYLTHKLEVFLQSIKTKTEVLPPINDPVYQIPVRFTLVGSETANLMLSIPAWSYENINFRNNELTLYSDIKPSATQSQITGKLTISPELVKNDPILHSIATNRQFSIETVHAIDYSPIIKTDICYTQNDSLFCFNPVINNLSVASVRWSFGDGSESTEYSPKHIYHNAGKYQVCLLINERIKTTQSVEIKPATMGKSAEPEINTKEEAVEGHLPAKAQSGGSDTEIIPHIIHELMEESEFADIRKKLDSYKKTKKLLWGKMQDFLYPEKCWLIIINPDNGKLEGVLSPGKIKRVEFMSKTEVTDYQKAYNGKSVICVQLN